MTAAAIRTEQLTKRYGSARGIDEVDLVVGAGEVFGFLGPNGAGKTTTIRILLDHIRPTSGRAEVLGLDAQRDSVEVRRRVGFLPSDMALYPDLTGGEILTLLANLRGGVDRAHRDRLVERFGVQLDRPVRDLSMGNRQKIGVVAAFMSDPALVVLDEPTTGLDPLVQQEFQALVREVSANGTTVFLSSHTLSEVERVADRVGIIREGRLVVTERIEELKRKAVRRLEFDFGEPVEVEPFARLDGVLAAEVADTVVRLSIRGPVGEAVTLAAQHRLLNVVSAEPDLEELFLTYYRPQAEVTA
jgi:ABC-2 type transport system ATP-binding protein